MKLHLLTSLSLHDAKRFSLDHETAREGAIVDVKEAAADELVKRGWAVAAADELVKRGWAVAAPADPVKADPPKATKIEGVPAAGKPTNG